MGVRGRRGPYICMEPAQGGVGGPGHAGPRGAALSTVWAQQWRSSGLSTTFAPPSIGRNAPGTGGFRLPRMVEAAAPDNVEASEEHGVR